MRGAVGEGTSSRIGRQLGTLGGCPSSPSGLHASAAPWSAANCPQTVAMTAVAVLRNDSLQAFLQVRAGLGGGEGKMEGSRIDLSWYL